jgi:hypothetical protein
MQAGGGGAEFTVSVAVAEFPVSASPTYRLSEVLTSEPVAVAVTATLIVQELPPPTVPPVKVRTVSSGAGEKMGVPQPLVLVVAGSATFSPLGKVSVKE